MYEVAAHDAVIDLDHLAGDAHLFTAQLGAFGVEFSHGDRFRGQGEGCEQQAAQGRDKFNSLGHYAFLKVGAPFLSQIGVNEKHRRRDPSF